MDVRLLVLRAFVDPLRVAVSFLEPIINIVRIHVKGQASE